MVVFSTWAWTISPVSDPVKCRNWSIWCEPMSQRMPPKRSFTKNHGGRVFRFCLCGPSPTVCTTRPMAPPKISSSAFVTAGTSKRSEKLTDQIRPVRAWALLHGGQLLQRRAAGLVHHHVLARLHRLDGERRAVGGHGRDQNHPHLGVVEYAAAVRDPRDLGKDLVELRLGHGRPVGPVGVAGAALRLHLAEHPEDVAVVDPDHAELERHVIPLPACTSPPLRRTARAPRSADAPPAPRALARAAGGPWRPPPRNPRSPSGASPR
jgi:hypothetical protein